jgi:hypothetical protein
MSKHTDGPWKRRSIPGHLFEVSSETGEMVFRIRGGMMPVLEDARLIETAPELLDVLKQVLMKVDGLDMPAELWERAHAVVAKAEGSSNA